MSVLGRENYNIFDGCFDLMDQGIDQDGLLAYLHDEGAIVIEAVIITSKLYGGVKKAGRAIFNHPMWLTDIEAFAAQSNAGAELVKGWRESATTA